MEKTYVKIILFSMMLFTMAWPREVRLQHNSQQKSQCEMGLRGVTHSRIEENHKVHHQEILYNIGLAYYFFGCFSRERLSAGFFQ
jgi:hypothetical protein